jgi:phospholipase C
VPTCTFPNRSLFHAATSSGFVIKFPPGDAFPDYNTAETLFDRLDATGLN